MRLVDGIFFTLVSTVTCVALPKLLSMTLSSKKPQSILPKKSAMASNDAHISEYINLVPESGEWGVSSDKWEEEKDVALASYGVGEKK
ncbi:hypothetical protein [Anabaena azotica]|uniref:Uncharacterized protein n=1 Tax=Anabaena azotica FACHB-119 TaxID=947527 RepID=A0ABR8DEV5_9NOST|nr:hypothetical protein [Anabaena azotica]MBD2504651.1 hypothetical protein [Anabaena azotica FACHB-119]